jgi:hypothetical protein
MALGVRPQTIIDKVKGLGIDLSNGLTVEDTMYLTVSLGLGTMEIPSKDIGLLDGHYLVEVPSLNTLGLLHCIFVHIQGGIPDMYDPNKDKEGRNVYLIWEDTSILSLTKLYDFRKYKDKEETV